MENPEDALVRAMLSSDPEEAAHAFEKAAEIVQQQHQQLMRMLADAFGRLEKLYPDMIAAADRLADLGWTIPMHDMTPERLVSLALPANSDSTVEAALVAFLCGWRLGAAQSC